MAVPTGDVEGMPVRKEEDSFVGVVSDEAKKLWALHVEAATRGNQLIAEHKAKGDAVPQAETDTFHQQWALCHQEYKATNDLFWTSVRRQFPAIAIETYLALCTNWEIIVPKKENEDHATVNMIFLGLPCLFHGSLDETGE